MGAPITSEFEDSNRTRPQETSDPTNHPVNIVQKNDENDDKDESDENSDPKLQEDDPTSTALEENPDSQDGSRNSNDNVGSGDDRESGSYSADESEEDTDPTLWCSVTRLSHAQLLVWRLSTCPVCKQSLSRPRPHAVTIAKVPPAERAVSRPGTPSDASQDEGPPPRPRVGYSNRFLYDSDEIAVAEPWPHMLDLDRDRGKLSAAASVEPVVELVTIVRTNMNEHRLRLETPYSRGPNFFSTSGILTSSRVATTYIGLEVVVNSRSVIAAFKRMITYYPDLDLSGTSLKIAQPYAVFYHYRDEIKSYRRTYPGSSDYRSDYHHPDADRAGFKTCDEETYEHLGAMQEVIEGESLHEVEKEMMLHQQTPSVATYHMLWLLFKPGTKVYRFERGRRTAGVVLSVEMDNPIEGKADALYIRYWHLGFNGYKLGRSEDYCLLKPFEGSRRITELEICPCSFYDAEDSGSLRESLIDQGKKYWRLIQGSQVDYSGKLPTDNTEWDGRVIIDPSTYYVHALDWNDGRVTSRSQELMAPIIGDVQDSLIIFSRPSDKNASWRIPGQMRPPPPPMMGPPPPMRVGPPPPPPPPPGAGWQGEDARRLVYEAGPWAEYDNIFLEDTESLELVDSATGQRDMSRYLLCPRDVVGFDLKARQWRMFDVAYCKDAVYNIDAINNLVMPDERKTIIRSLVYRYTDPEVVDGKVPKPWTADFIKNKGEGQIFLLHGSPGVGKTYTAECIAEATRRPLLSLTCGDIGTNEVRAEQQLSKWFRLAELWGAVMLLDEADVFLEKRSMSDLQRNSLVSVFLRMIEYYRGILFLTTNRVGQFDDAFISRIHSVIHYGNFSRIEQHRIWTQFFTKLETERRKDMRIDRSARRFVFESAEIQRIEWNGRQIRNAFQTAVAFAEYRFLHLKPEEREEGEKASLEEEDFAKVCQMTMAFQRYMDSVHGGNEAKRARIHGIRNDAFDVGAQ